MDRHTWQQINDLSAEGIGLRAIARRLGIHRRTVRAGLDAEHPPSRAGTSRGSIIDPYRGWLLARLAQYPELTATALFRQLQERDYNDPGSCPQLGPFREAVPLVPAGPFP